MTETMQQELAAFLCTFDRINQIRKWRVAAIPYIIPERTLRALVSRKYVDELADRGGGVPWLSPTKLGRVACRKAGPPLTTERT